jgi:hypothetical protein
MSIVWLRCVAFGAVDTLIKGTPNPEQVRRRLDAPSDLRTEFDDLQVSLTKLRDLLDSVAAYLDAVAVCEWLMMLMLFIYFCCCVCRWC